MNFEIKDNIITIDCKHAIEFDFNVNSVTGIKNAIIVLLDIPPKESMSENIFAVSDNGKFYGMLNHAQTYLGMIRRIGTWGYTTKNLM